MADLRLAVSYTHYPCSVGRFFAAGFRSIPGVEVRTIGPCSHGILPWQPETDFSAYRDLPDVELFLQQLYKHPRVDALAALRDQLNFVPDALVMVDAGFYLDGGVPGLPTALIASDPHCVSGNTMLATDHGILTAQEVAGYPIHVHDKTGEVTCAAVAQTAFKATRRIVLETGQEVVCTDEHLIETRSGFRPAMALKPDDEVVLACGTYQPPEGGARDYSVGLVLGAFQGDGSFGREGFVKFTLGKERKAAINAAMF